MVPSVVEDIREGLTRVVQDPGEGIVNHAVEEEGRFCKGLMNHNVIFNSEKAFVGSSGEEEGGKRGILFFGLGMRKVVRM